MKKNRNKVISWKTQARFPMYRPDHACCAQSRQKLRKL